MTDGVFTAAVFVATLASGLVAGVFFAFSSFVMAALGRLPPAEGIAAMNSINVTVINPLFMLALFGTGLLCIALAIGAIGAWEQAGSKWILVASALYLFGCTGVTLLRNVPLNDALAAAPQDLTLWSRYLGEWTFWNHVRTVASLLPALLFAMALRYP